MVSSAAAASRTERTNAPSSQSQCQNSACAGPSEVRPREPLSPTSPQKEAGIRTDPPASLPCAIATMPEATAAAAPPLDPPAVRSVFQGLRVAPHARVSVESVAPHSGTVLCASVIRPAARNFAATYEVDCATIFASLNGFHPQLNGSPSIVWSRSFIRNGTPRKTPLGMALRSRASARALL